MPIYQLLTHKKSTILLNYLKTFTAEKIAGCHLKFYHFKTLKNEA